MRRGSLSISVFRPRSAAVYLPLKAPNWLRPKVNEAALGKGFPLSLSPSLLLLLLCISPGTCFDWDSYSASVSDSYLVLCSFFLTYFSSFPLQSYAVYLFKHIQCICKRICISSGELVSWSYRSLLKDFLSIMPVFARMSTGIRFLVLFIQQASSEWETASN